MGYAVKGSVDTLKGFRGLKEKQTWWHLYVSRQE